MASELFFNLPLRLSIAFFAFRVPLTLDKILFKLSINSLVLTSSVIILSNSSFAYKVLAGSFLSVSALIVT